VTHSGSIRFAFCHSVTLSTNVKYYWNFYPFFSFFFFTHARNVFYITEQVSMIIKKQGIKESISWDQCDMIFAIFDLQWLFISTFQTLLHISHSAAGGSVTAWGGWRLSAILSHVLASHLAQLVRALSIMDERRIMCVAMHNLAEATSIFG